ncbi:diguanylate cyclase [Cohnella soli]|uniref:Diguanylate cyclase n=1 Tax=Cohnella soli TaxID=425005 RepID=A0ABW0HMH8_9BACL
MRDKSYKHLIKQRMQNVLDDWSSKETVEETEIYRFLHNTKGTAGTIGLPDIAYEASIRMERFSESGTRRWTYSEWYNELQSLFDLLPGIQGKEERRGEGEGDPPTASLPDRMGKRILVVDDDVDLAGYLKGILEERGYPVNIALTAERGLKLFYDWKPDLILLDVFLPDTNGMDVLRQIVDKAQLEHSPVIVISTEDTREHRMHAYRFGAMDFFPKPIDQELLVALIENRFQLIRHWQHSIIVDELTGAYNRKHLNRSMQQLISDYRRESQIFSVAMMDLDHFKKVNDTYGHPMGDEVLRSFAATVMETKRERDTLCRYGGEEFSLLLPDTNREQALELLQRIRVSFSEKTFSAGDDTFRVTFSSGITDIHDANAHAMQLIEEADQALYSGKQAGRNRTVVYAPQLSQDSAAKRLHLLVVDDDPLIRNIIVSHFERWQPDRNTQVSIQSYEDGVQFIASDWYSEQSKYIVLLDGAMPGMDGAEVLSKLREGYPERNIVIAMLTARVNQADIIYALQQGADDYIVKPFKPEELMERVERLAHKLFN